MLYLALYVFCSMLLGFIFKLYPRYKVDTFQAIVVNYMTCVCCGWIHLGHFPYAYGENAVNWLPYALFLGIVFISGFNGAAQTVRHFGVTISQVMQKMSILLTVPFAVLIYHESSGAAKIVGFLLALASIIAVNWPKSVDQSNAAVKNETKGYLWIPIITWLLAGVIEVTFLWTNGEKITSTGDIAFISTVFGTAGLAGMAFWVMKSMRGDMPFSWRNVIGGILLGIPNYGSMLFLLMALGSGLEGSFVFPVGNVAIILLTTFGAVAFFQEKLSLVNWLGVVLAVAAIGLIAW
jgi:drug/metabolite transporter (DMT)-like permease